MLSRWKVWFPVASAKRPKYSLGAAGALLGGPADVTAEVAPRPDEPMVSTRANKFYNTNLDELLKARGTKTTLMVGTAAHGAVLYPPTKRLSGAIRWQWPRMGFLRRIP